MVWLRVSLLGRGPGRAWCPASRGQRDQAAEGRGVMRPLDLEAGGARVQVEARAIPVDSCPARARALHQMALPYWQENPGARWKLAGVVGLTLATTGVR